MGTRRSRHNKGRKPLYKHFERDTIRAFSFDDQPKERPKFVPPPEKRGNYTAPRTQKVIELEEQVARFMEARAKSRASLEEKKREHLPERTEVETVHGRENIRVSEADVLLQLFQDRKISGKQLQAGRAWQFNLHRATLQPLATIAWDQDASARPYQSRGTVSDGQWQAMRRRRAFRSQVSAEMVGLADFCLGRDWRRAELMVALRINHDRLVDIIDNMLSSIALHFGTQFVQRHDTEQAELRLREMVQC